MFRVKWKAPTPPAPHVNGSNSAFRLTNGSISCDGNPFFGETRKNLAASKAKVFFQDWVAHVNVSSEQCQKEENLFDHFIRRFADPPEIHIQSCYDVGCNIPDCNIVLEPIKGDDTLA